VQFFNVVINLGVFFFFKELAQNPWFKLCSLTSSLVVGTLQSMDQRQSFDFLRSGGQGFMYSTPLPAGLFFDERENCPMPILILI